MIKTRMPHHNYDYIFSWKYRAGGYRMIRFNGFNLMEVELSDE